MQLLLVGMDETKVRAMFEKHFAPERWRILSCRDLELAERLVSV